ncbi:CLUMA_CG014869, isoform A [Clunio marinus]|uniref:CLUMA_CG014869, isoform A n=1 Tax=Clunio marinus TaxID=568069 RepID=A0A1J1IRE4_9DIPT|nr:CLUMA_CG014869, isoform A [Clunio marinus]
MLCHINAHFANPYITSGSSFLDDRNCFQNYIEKNEYIDTDCENLMVHAKSIFERNIIKIFDVNNITDCGLQFLKDYNVEKILLKAIGKGLVNLTSTEDDFDYRTNKNIRSIAKSAKTYCKADLFCDLFLLDQRYPNFTLTPYQVCMMKHLTDINIIDPKLYKIDEARYVEENCETYFMKWRIKFPNEYLLLDLVFPTTFFGVSSNNIYDCYTQKVKDGKINELLASYEILVTFELSDQQFKEIRNKAIDLTSTSVKNMFECLNEIF